MPIRESSNEVTTSNSPLDFVRKNISIILMSLIGASAIPACSVSLSLGCKTAEGARELVVGEKGVRHIRLPELKATILVYTIEKKVGNEDKTFVEAIFHVQKSSILRKSSSEQSSSELREYKLPKTAYPFIAIVVDPSGRIGLRVDENKIAMVCEKLEDSEDQTNKLTCQLDEIDHKELKKRHAFAVKEAKANEAAEAKHAEAAAEAEEEAEKVAAKEKAEADCYNFTDADNNPESAPTSFPKILFANTILTDIFEPVLMARIANDSEYLKSLVRHLAGETWKIAAENLIRDIEQNKQTMEDIIGPLVFLLKKNPDQVKDIAGDLGITLPDEIFVNAVKTVVKEPNKVLEKMKSLLNPTPLDKLRIAAKMISSGGKHKQIDGKNKEQVTAQILDWLGEHYKNNDYGALIAVVNFLKGELTDADRKYIKNTYNHEAPKNEKKEKTETNAKEKEIAAKFRRIQNEVRQHLNRIKEAGKDLEKVREKLRNH